MNSGQAADVNLDPLQNKLQRLYTKQLGAAVSSRIPNVHTFFPFTRDESTLIMHVEFRRLIAKYERLVDPGLLPEGRTLGSCIVSFSNGLAICRQLAETSYSEDGGARTLWERAMKVGDQLTEAYRRDEIRPKMYKGQPKEKFELQIHLEGGNKVVKVVRV